MNHILTIVLTRITRVQTFRPAPVLAVVMDEHIVRDR